MIAKRKAFWGVFFYTSKTLYLIFILSENFCMQVSYPFSVTLTLHYCLIVQRGDFGGDFFMPWIDGLWFLFSKKILHFGVLTILSHSCSQSLFNNTKGSIGGIFFPLKTWSLITITLKDFFPLVSYPFSVNMAVHEWLIVQRRDFWGDFFMP